MDIHASPEVIWSLLTNAQNYSSWNPTVISIEGTIAPNSLIQLKSKLDPKCTFKLKIKEFIPNQKLVWGDAMGNRRYTLIQKDSHITHVTMEEKIGVHYSLYFLK